ncbi:hypothetical protein [Burkholderia phage BCSR5]|nr:hypothetical protein [Burkholderia phage BCSR5]
MSDMKTVGAAAHREHLVNVLRSASLLGAAFTRTSAKRSLDAVLKELPLSLLLSPEEADTLENFVTHYTAFASALEAQRTAENADYIEHELRTLRKLRSLAGDILDLDLDDEVEKDECKPEGLEELAKGWPFEDKSAGDPIAAAFVAVRSNIPEWDVTEEEASMFYDRAKNASIQNEGGDEHVYFERRPLNGVRRYPVRGERTNGTWYFEAVPYAGF